jgi:hypothetical protein
MYCAIAFPPAPLLCCFCLFLYLLKWEIIYSLSDKSPYLHCQGSIRTLQNMFRFVHSSALVRIFEIHVRGNDLKKVFLPKFF